MNDLPKGWEWKKLGDVCDIYNGSTPSRNKKEYWGGDILWATPTDVSNLGTKYIENTREQITKEGYGSCSTHLLPKGSVIFTSRASIGHIAITKKELCTNQGFKNFVCKQELLPEFLLYCLKLKKKDIENLGSGSTFKEVSMSTIKQVEIPIPPLAVQKRIIAILERAESIKQKREEANTDTDTIIQSIFYEMFGDTVKNEKGWNASKLNDEINILGGYAFKSVDFVVEGIPLIKIGTVNKGYFDKSDLSYLPFNYLKEYERYLIEKGDLLISLTGTIGKDDYGNICICDDSEKYLLNQRVAKLIPKKSINPYYLMYLFKNKDVKNKLTKLSRGIRQANISNRDILNLTVPMPPISLQNKFAEIVKKTESIKITQSESTSDINNLFDALMQKAFNGELVE